MKVKFQCKSCNLWNVRDASRATRVSTFDDEAKDYYVMQCEKCKTENRVILPKDKK